MVQLKRSGRKEPVDHDEEAQVAVYDALLFFLLIIVAIIIIAYLTDLGTWKQDVETKDYGLTYTHDTAEVLWATTIPRAQFTEGGITIVLYQKPIDQLCLEELYVMRNASGGDFSSIHKYIQDTLFNLTRPKYRYSVLAYEPMGDNTFKIEDNVAVPTNHYGQRTTYDMLDKYGTAELTLMIWEV